MHISPRESVCIYERAEGRSVRRQSQANFKIGRRKSIVPRSGCCPCSEMRYIDRWDDELG